MNQELKNYAMKVKAMRDEQKEYFSKRSNTAMFKAKDLEKKIDKLTDSILSQMDLFAEEGKEADNA